MSDNQTLPVEILVKPIGYLAINQGTVDLHSGNGEVHTVSDDIMVFYEDTVVVNNAASGRIVFFNNLSEDITFGPGDIVRLKDEVFIGTEQEDLEALAQGSEAEIAALQSAILEGVDPSEIQEAPAAGEQFFQYSLGQSYSVNIDRNSIYLLAGYGFDTQGNPLEHLSLPNFGYLTQGVLRETNLVDETQNERSINNAVEETLTYSIVGAAPTGFILDSVTGSWTFDAENSAYDYLAEGEVANVDVVVSISSTNGNVVEQTISIAVTGTNDAPTATANIITQAAVVDGIVTGNVDAIDVDGDTLTYALADDVAGFTLDTETGEWSFDPSDAAYEQLAAGETAEVVVSVVVSDGNGGTVQQDITLNLVGTNDAPVADATNNVDASGNVSTRSIPRLVVGSVGATDADGDTLSYAVVEDVDGFNINPETGVWTFDPSDEAYAELAVGEEAEVVVSVVVSDGNGGTTQQDITLNLVGTNDAPVADATNTVDASDIAEVVTGSVDATDVDGDTLTYALVDEVAGFTLDTGTGTWTFDPSDDAYAELAVGEEVDVVVSVVVSDGNGGTTQQDITLNLVGTNDAPVADATKTVDASDIAELVTGSVDATDVDGDTLSYELVEAVAGFTLNPETGTWSFDPSDEAYAELAVGEEAEVVVSVVVSDGNGGTTQQDITLNLVGTNDAPVADATNNVDASDIAEVVTGSVDATDVDGDTLTYELVEEVVGFTLNPETGTWTFDPSDEAYAELAVGEEAEVVVSVVVSDGNGGTTQQDITLNLVGTNDAPVADATKTVDASDIAEIVTGSVDATDVDGDTLAYELVEAVAGFTLNPETGTWTFDPSDDAYAELAVGEEAEVVVSVVVSDGNGGSTQQDITLNLVGTNDAPVAEAMKTVDASDIAEVVTGSVDATDVDGDTLTYELVEEVAGFTLNPETGEWSFDPSDEAYAELAVGEEAEVVVSVVVSDGNGGSTQQDITLNLVGTNDAPVAEAMKTVDASDIAEVVTGSIDATDVDGDTLTYELVEEVAGFTLNPETGEWSFDPSDDAYAELAVGEEAEVVVSVVVSDGNGGTTQQDITLNLVGTNDAPVADATKTVDASDIAEVVTGSVDATDVDGDTLTYALVEEIAGFTLNPETGEWSFDPSDEAYAELAVGEEAEVVVSVVVSDGNGGTTQQDITLNLIGTNDAPVADATNTVDASDIAEVVTGSVDATDVDGDTLTYELVEEVAGFSLDAETGEWSFDPSDEAYAELAVGEEAEVVVSVVVSDGNGGTTQQDITLNLVGTNDAPVADATKTVDASDIAEVVTGSIDATDVDSDTLTYELVEEIDGFTLNPETGTWTFDPSDEAYAELAVGEEAEVVVSVVVSDGNGGTTQQDITLNLVGTNDAPVADATNNVDASDIAEVVTGSVDATDVDGDTLTYELVEAVAGFTLDTETGTWAFDPSDEAYAELAVGEEAEVVVSVVVSDGNGGTTQQDITLNLVGTNDAPVADATKTVDASDIAELVTGSVDATDVDGDTLSYELVEEVAGFTLNPETGTWTFDPSDEAYAELAVGEEAEVVVSVVVSDGNGGTTQQDITLNLVGTNDAPVAADQTVTIQEDSSAITLDVLQESYDVDGDDLIITGASVPAEQGVVSVVDNKLIFTASENFNGTASIEYTVSDGELTDTAEVTVNVLAVDDASVISGDDESFVYEEDSRKTAENLVYTTGKLTVTDVDEEDTPTFDTSSVVKAEGVVGDLVITEDGTWTYVVDAANELQYLAAGQTLEETFSVTTSNGVSQDIVVTVIGQDDDSVIAQNNQELNFSEDIIFPAFPFDLTITDVDEGETPYFESTTITGEYGYVEYTASSETVGEGSWVYHYDYDKGQELESGKFTEVFTLTASDGAEYKITVNINGINDAPVVEAIAEQTALEGGELISGQINATDVDSDDLTYTVSGDVPAGFELADDGSWTFDPTVEAYEVLTSEEQQEIEIEVQVSDGDNTVSEIIKITVVGTDDETGPTAIAPVAVDDRNTVTTGLVGEYYGTNSQINSIADFRSVVESKEPDATYVAANIDYAIGSGGIATGTNLQEFLGTDSLTINTDPSDYSDGGLHLQGYIYLEAGSYNFKVYADDGYQILVNGEDVASVDHNQAPTTDVFSEFTITESGYQAIDMVWWDQGGRYVFQPTLSSDGGQTYTVIDESILSSSNQSSLITEMDQAIEISQESLLANDSDANGDSLSIVSLSNATNGYAYITAAGVINFIPSADFSGEGSFDYTITDGNGGYDTATAVIEVEDNSVLPTVTVQVSEQNPYGLWTGFSSASEADYAYEDYSNYQNFSNTDNKIYVNQNVNASLNLKAGDDSVDIGADVNSGGYIDLGGGNNNMIVGGSVYHSIAAGSGNDQLQIGEDLSASINLGGGNNYLVIGGNVNSGASINLTGGNDQVRIGGDVNSAINLGNGTNTLVIGGSVSASVQAGSGDDSISIGGDVNSYINLGSGDNTLQIGGNLYAGIGLGNGSDFIVLEGFKDSDVYVDAGSNGTDSIVLNAYSLEDYQQNKDNIQTKLVGFENIKLSDGFVEGSDEAVFDEYIANGLNIGSEGDSSSYEYDLSLTLDETEATVAATSLTLSLIGIPDSSDVSLLYSGEELTAGSDGTYDISLEEGQTSVDNLILVSKVELTDLDVEVVATSTTNDENANDGVLEGTDGLDVLVGGLGKNVLFGGSDDAADTLTGGSGHDIFVLNKVSSEDNLDTITDFNASEDSLDLTSLLVGLDGQPDDNADQDTIAAFIADHVQVNQDGTVTVDDESVANFTEETSSFDANQDGDVNTYDAIRVVYNNIEYSINVDG